MLLAALLLAVQHDAADCRLRSPEGDLQHCPLERRRNDVLDAVHRPAITGLGGDAFRLSTMPSLGGTAAVVEIADNGRSRLVARFYELDGHPREGWLIVEHRTFTISRREYAELAAGLDRAISGYRRPDVDPENGESIVCMDGPGFLTERVVRGATTSLRGNCPPAENAEHPNSQIVRLFVKVTCRHLGHDAASALLPYDRQLRLRCSTT